MKEEKKAKQKKEMNEKEKQGTIMLIGLFFLVAAAFAVSGIANVLYGNVPAGIDRILGAVALFSRGIGYIVRERR